MAKITLEELIEKGIASCLSEKGTSQKDLPIADLVKMYPSWAASQIELLLNERDSLRTTVTALSEKIPENEEGGEELDKSK